MPKNKSALKTKSFGVSIGIAIFCITILVLSLVMMFAPAPEGGSTGTASLSDNIKNGGSFNATATGSVTIYDADGNPIINDAEVQSLYDLSNQIPIQTAGFFQLAYVVGGDQIKIDTLTVSAKLWVHRVIYDDQNEQDSKYYLVEEKTFTEQTNTYSFDFDLLDYLPNTTLADKSPVKFRLFLPVNMSIQDDYENTLHDDVTFAYLVDCVWDAPESELETDPNQKTVIKTTYEDWNNNGIVDHVTYQYSDGTMETFEIEENPDLPDGALSTIGLGLPSRGAGIPFPIVAIVLVAGLGTVIYIYWNVFNFRADKRGKRR